MAKGTMSTVSGALHEGSTCLSTWPRTALAHCRPLIRHLSYPVAQDKNPGLLFSHPPHQSISWPLSTPPRLSAVQPSRTTAKSPPTGFPLQMKKNPESFLWPPQLYTTWPAPASLMSDLIYYRPLHLPPSSQGLPFCLKRARPGL